MSTTTVTPEIRMANDILRQLTHLPDEQAVQIVVEHMTKFWTPAMRHRLHQAGQDGAEGLCPRLHAVAHQIGA